MTEKRFAMLVPLVVLLAAMLACSTSDLAPAHPTSPAEEALEPTRPAPEARATPVPTSEPTATPTTPPEPTSAPSGTLVAFPREGRLWIMEGEEPERPLTAGPADSAPLFSPDGRWLLFRRELPPAPTGLERFELRAIAIDGSGERVLVGPEDLPAGSAPIADSDEELPLDRLPWETVWLPDSRTVAFNTVMVVGYGHAPNDDLWLLDVESGATTQLLADDEGGRFAFSPDASRVVVCTHETVTIMDADGGNRRTLVIFDPVITYSEYAYQPQPVWASDGSHALVAISSRDPAEPDARATIWRLPLSGDAVSLGTLPDRFLLNTGTDALWSAERTHIAYVAVVEDGEARSHELVIAQADGSDPVVYAAGELDFLGWARQGAEFAYWHHVASEVYRGVVGQPPVQLLGSRDENTAVISVSWFGEDMLVYVVAEAGEFTIWSGPVGGEHRIIGQVVGYAPGIDIWE